ncbi:MAG: hypothetical protein HC897_00720 [Thermoanaerobaculia bacterium]|nr:hypothetical protein [Thermoanaerobaculia bacterium]
MKEKSLHMKPPALIASLQQAIAASPEGRAGVARAAGLEEAALDDFLDSPGAWEFAVWFERLAASVGRELRLALVNGGEAANDLESDTGFEQATVDPYLTRPAIPEESLLATQVDAPITDLLLDLPPWPQLGAEVGSQVRRSWQSLESAKVPGQFLNSRRDEGRQGSPSVLRTVLGCVDRPEKRRDEPSERAFDPVSTPPLGENRPLEAHLPHVEPSPGSAFASQSTHRTAFRVSVDAPTISPYST